MKNHTLFCTLIAIAIGGKAISSGIDRITDEMANEMANGLSVEAPEMSKSENYPEDDLENNYAISGMFFTSASVVGEYEYDDAYCLLYDDADANMFNVEICVDLETYQMVQSAIKSGEHIVGTLVLNDDYSYGGMEVFTYMPEPEFEMAEASANIN